MTNRRLTWSVPGICRGSINLNFCYSWKAKGRELVVFCCLLFTLLEYKIDKCFDLTVALLALTELSSLGMQTHALRAEAKRGIAIQ